MPLTGRKWAAAQPQAGLLTVLFCLSHPRPQHAQGLLGGREGLGAARLAGEREGGALEDAGGPDRNLAPLVTGEVGELGRGLHSGHPAHGFKS